MYFSTLRWFFIFFSAVGGTILPPTCGYYSTTARFSFHPASAQHPCARVGLIPKQQPSPSVGYYSTTTCGYYSTTARFSFFSRRVRFLFSTCAFRASARSPRSDFPREEDSLRFCLFRENCVVVDTANRGRAGHERSAEPRTAARASPSGRTQTRARTALDACLARFRSAPGDAREGRTQTRVKKKRSSRVTTAAIARRTRWTRTRTPAGDADARTSRRPVSTPGVSSGPPPGSVERLELETLKRRELASGGTRPRPTPDPPGARLCARWRRRRRSAASHSARATGPSSLPAFRNRRTRARSRSGRRRSTNPRLPRSTRRPRSRGRSR